MWSGIFLIMLAMLPTIFLVLSLSKMYPWYSDAMKIADSRVKKSGYITPEQRKKHGSTTAQTTQIQPIPKCACANNLSSNPQDASKTQRDQTQKTSEIATPADDSSERKIPAHIYPKIRSEALRLYKELGAFCECCDSPLEDFDRKLTLSQKRRHRTARKLSSEQTSASSIDPSRFDSKLNWSQTSRLCREKTEEFCPIADSLSECFDKLIPSEEWPPHPWPMRNSSPKSKHTRKSPPESYARKRGRSSRRDSIRKPGRLEDRQRQAKSKSPKKSSNKTVGFGPKSFRDSVRKPERPDSSRAYKSSPRTSPHPMHASNKRLIRDSSERSLHHQYRRQSPAQITRKPFSESRRQSFRESCGRTDRDSVKKTKNTKDSHLLYPGNNAYVKYPSKSPRSPDRKSRPKSGGQFPKSDERSFHDSDQKSKCLKESHSVDKAYSDTDSMARYTRKYVVEIGGPSVSKYGENSRRNSFQRQRYSQCCFPRTVVERSCCQAAISSASKNTCTPTILLQKFSFSDTSCHSVRDLYKNPKYLQTKSQSRSLSEPIEPCKSSCCVYSPDSHTVHRCTCSTTQISPVSQNDHDQKQNKQTSTNCKCQK